jgi:hypothetical protein
LPRPKIKEAVLADLGWLGFVELEKMSTGFLTIGTDPMNLNFAAMPEAACERGVKIEDLAKTDTAGRQADGHALHIRKSNLISQSFAGRRDSRKAR